jgi:hypothetical protein
MKLQTVLGAAALFVAYSSMHAQSNLGAQTLAFSNDNNQLAMERSGEGLATAKTELRPVDPPKVPTGGEPGSSVNRQERQPNPAPPELLADASFRPQYATGSGMAKLGLAGGSAMILPVESTRVSERTGGNKLWWASAAALAAANVADIQSSWGKRELNGSLAGKDSTFGSAGTLIKLGIFAGVCTIEYLALHHNPSPAMYRRLAIINFGDASLTGGMAIRNYGIPGR